MTRLLHVTRVFEDQTMTVKAAGQLDATTAGLLEHELEAAEAAVAPPTPVVLDLTQVTFLGSPGLAILLDHHRRCAALGSSLQIVTGGRAVTRPLWITHLDRTLHLISATPRR
jgi:anti-sigma B factor antagonist